LQQNKLFSANRPLGKLYALSKSELLLSKMLTTTLKGAYEKLFSLCRKGFRNLSLARTLFKQDTPRWYAYHLATWIPIHITALSATTQQRYSHSLCTG
jgi:hypothetical protein